MALAVAGLPALGHGQAGAPVAPPEAPASAAVAAPVDPAVQAQYERDRTWCITQRLPSERQTCLREAAAAREAAARRVPVDDGAEAEYRRNALRRCEPLPPDDRADCEARLRGEGIQRGSVGEGGIYRELRRVLPAASAPVAPASAASGS